MNTLDAMLAAIVADPVEETRWLVLADWLEENDDDLRRGELLRLHRKLLATCCEPDANPERTGWQSRLVELLVAGVQPCVPRKTLVLPGGVPMTLAFVPPGSFLMGSNHPEGEEDEKPVHRVELTKGFYLGVHPVTQSQWEAVMGSTPSRFKGGKRPVEQVSWDDCREFCGKVGASQEPGLRVELPTEAEWECACRAGTTTEYHFGEVLNTDLVNYNGDYRWNGSVKGKNRGETTEVGLFPYNAWGLCDMHGNVWEWCSDRYGDYAVGNQKDSQEQSNGLYRAMRGGSWLDLPVLCRAASRWMSGRGNSNYRSGFRVCFRLHAPKSSFLIQLDWP